ncbi:SbcC/MukB-like Walker B domain-containing protein [Magnetospirillum molischianum]|uniref:Uncharacterized protein n=1 Tax=Magnetospirillum molischianum DSM 120 TaxID=1150626 RepID=H8FMV0_MAGML|nr:SbcC/MukB-like Walker B domain-containing protein [Magnetospirillum molischianum]CCG39688.1 conserved hypothetical protein [Magnetospirillum molischianum DSM 120]
MYELVNVALIDWFLLGRQDIPLRGAVGVYGENRSGKSTLLDAIQTAMLSNDKNALQLNAAANPEKKRKNRRSVHGYCLGRLGGAGEPPLRDAARSHIALAYRDSIDGRYVSTGLIFEARQSETREETTARWLVTGIKVDSADLVLSGPDGDVARTWPELEAHLEARCAAEGGEVRVYMSPSEHIGDMLHWCSQSGQHGGIDQFRRAFANAVSFETIDDESQFVRTYVLDRDAISIRGLRESMRNYREIAETIRRLLQQVEDLDAILAAAHRHTALVEEKYHRAWMMRRAKVLLALRDVRKHRKALRSAQNDVARLKRIIEDCERQSIELRDEKQGLERSVRSSEVAGELARVELDLEQKKGQLAEVMAPVRHWELAVTRAASIPGQTGPALDILRERAPALLTALNTLQRLSGADKLPVWPVDPDALARIIDQMPDLDGLCRTLGDLADDRLRGLGTQEIEDLHRRLEAIEKTGSAISSETGAFLFDLEAEGFSPKLVCAEIEMLDPDWRDAAETILGRDREAVVLPPDQARRAIALLRERRHTGRYHGCRVVNTTRIETGRSPPGSLASVLRARNPLVAAFIVHRLGNVRLVETEAELQEGGRAVTKDCAYCDGLVTEIRQVGERKIGADATGALRRDLESRLRVLLSEQSETKDLVHGLRSLAERLTPLAAARTHGVGLVDAVFAYRDKLRQIEGLRGQIKRLQDYVHPEISRRVAEIDSDLAALALELSGDPDGADPDSRKGAKRLLDDALRAEGTATTGCNSGLPDLIVALNFYREERARGIFAQAMPLWIAERARSRGALPPIVRSCDERLTVLAEEIPRANKAVFAQIFEFRRTSQRDLGFTIDSSIGEEIVPWASRLRNDIADKDLAQHRRRADEAVDEAQKLLKGNFVNMLRDRFERVTNAISMLNNVLRQHAFHNERYRFEVEPDADFVGLIDLVVAATQDEMILLPLFGGAEIEKSLHAESLKMVEAILMEDDLDYSRYEDYRNYFRFNLVMTDIETGKATTFAHRLGVGSGAEKQVPFYVAIGAALASAYHNGLYAASKPGGLGLALFDEAFMKMDPKNQREVLHFYREIGLQPVLAGPKGGKLFMQKFMDTLVKVARPSYRRMAITVTHPGTALKEALMTEDPSEWSRETLERLYSTLRP